MVESLNASLRKSKTMLSQSSSRLAKFRFFHYPRMAIVVISQKMTKKGEALRKVIRYYAKVCICVILSMLNDRRSSFTVLQK